jgi:uncharacterized protein YukE
MPDMKAVHKKTGEIVYDVEQLNALAKTATKSSKALDSSYKGATSAVISYAETVQKSYEKLEEFSNTTLEKIKNNFNNKGPEISQAVNGIFGAEGSISKTYSKHSEDAVKSLQSITTE